MIVQMPLDLWIDRDSDVYRASKAMIHACGDELLEPKTFDDARGGVLFHRDMPRYKPKRDTPRNLRLAYALSLAENHLVLTLPPFRGGIRRTIGDRSARLSLNGFWWDDAEFGVTMTEGPERFAAICEDQDIAVLPMKQGPIRTVAIMLQRRDDSSVRVDIDGWAAAEAGRHAAMGRAVVVRTHPSDCYQPTAKATVHKGGDVPIAKTLAWADLAVCHTSTSGVDATIAGVPVETDPGNMAAPVVGRPEFREQLLNTLAHCQWRFSEMEEGHPWDNLRARI